MGVGWVEDIRDDRVSVSFSGGRIDAAYVFNCTYAYLDLVGVPLRSAVKRELAELLLIEPPRDLEGLGVTVLDGPFFSTMPFPAAHLHSLSHVRYTPHEAWHEGFQGIVTPHRTNRDAMVRDASRYLPCLARSKFVRSLFDLKAVLVRNEDDDGRPVLFERNSIQRVDVIRAVSRMELRKLHAQHGVFNLGKVSPRTEAMNSKSSSATFMPV